MKEKDTEPNPGRTTFPSRVTVIRGFLVVMVGALVAGPPAGCAAGQRGGGSGLSDAVRASAKAERERDSAEEGHKKKADEGPEVLHAGRRVVETADVVVLADAGACDHRVRGVAGQGSPRNTPEFYLGLSASQTGYDEGGFRDSRFFAVRAGVIFPEPEDRLHLELELAVSPTRFRPDLAAGLRNASEFSAGLETRYYLTEPDQSGIHLLGGFRGGLLWWEYAEPIFVEEYGRVRKVEDDFICTYNPYVGLGGTIGKAGGVRLGAAVIGGFKFFDDFTNEGLWNDLFDPVPFAQLRFDLTHVFE